MVGSIFVNTGKQIVLNRSYKATPDYTVVTEFKVGISNTDPAVGDTDLDVAIPIEDGTVNDNGDNTLTGSLGGDNSTDNTTTFKPGAGTTDDTAQNLIANGTNVSKVWTIANLASLGTIISPLEPFGMWFFILDTTTRDKFLTAGTALEIRLGSDTSNYFSLTRTVSQLTTGFNWITSGTTIVQDLTETGTVVVPIDTFQILVTTNLAADTFIAGDVIYDLLRQWSTRDWYRR